MPYFPSNFNPRAPCGARPWLLHRCRWALRISIHVPLAGHDHARAGTPRIHDNFNPRAPCGARHIAVGYVFCLYVISIHVPLAGHDRRKPLARGKCAGRFQSTCPLRGTTADEAHTAYIFGISIHVPLAGHDDITATGDVVAGDFNPRAPCGARPLSRCSPLRQKNFNPRAPCGARLSFSTTARKSCLISIHVPLAGHDQRRQRRGLHHRLISIHVPLAGHDCKKAQRLLCIFVKTG